MSLGSRCDARSPICPPLVLLHVSKAVSRALTAGATGIHVHALRSKLAALHASHGAGVLRPGHCARLAASRSANSTLTRPTSIRTTITSLERSAVRSNGSASRGPWLSTVPERSVQATAFLPRCQRAELGVERRHAHRPRTARSDGLRCGLEFLTEWLRVALANCIDRARIYPRHARAAQRSLKKDDGGRTARAPGRPMGTSRGRLLREAAFLERRVDARSRLRTRQGPFAAPGAVRRRGVCSTWRMAPAYAKPNSS